MSRTRPTAWLASIIAVAVAAAGVVSISASPAANASEPIELPADAPNEVVALVETTYGPELRVFETGSRAETKELLAELAGTPEVISANPNWAYSYSQTAPEPLVAVEDVFELDADSQKGDPRDETTRYLELKDPAPVTTNDVGGEGVKTVTAVNAPAGSPIALRDGVVKFDTMAGHGTYTATYDIADESGATATGTITVHWLPAAPFGVDCDLKPVAAVTPESVLANFDARGGGTFADQLGASAAWQYVAKYGQISACTPDQGETVVVRVTGVNVLREFDNQRTWDFVFQSNFDGQPIANARYDHATTYGYNQPGAAGIAGKRTEVNGTGAADTKECAQAYGRFEVNDFGFDPATGAVTSLAVSFDMLCGTETQSPLHGELRLNSARPMNRPFGEEATDPYRPAQWALEALNAEKAWAKLLESGKLNCDEPRGIIPAQVDNYSDRLQDCIVVAVIDSGVQADNEDLLGMVTEGWYAADEHGTLKPEPTPTDPLGHGTAVASIIAAQVDNGYGMAGLGRWVRIKPFRLDEDKLTDAAIAASILSAVDQGTHVINLSLAGPEQSDVLADAISYAVRNNVVVVAASGNNGKDCEDGETSGHRCGNALMFPATYDGVISVGASDRDGEHVPFSNHSPRLNLSAPGVDIITLETGTGTTPTPGGDGGSDAACAGEDYRGANGSCYSGSSLNCDDIPTAAKPVAVLTSDPSGLDNDGDGLGCDTAASASYASVQSIAGTSFAAPYVSASVALVKLYHEQFEDADDDPQSPEDTDGDGDVDEDDTYPTEPESTGTFSKLSTWAITSHLERTATDLGEPGRDMYFGAGRPDLLAAFETAPVQESDVPGGPTFGGLDFETGLTVEADSADGAVVTFDVTATAQDGTELDALCTPQSGETFPVGETTVNCTAFDPAAGRTGFVSFVVTVTEPAADGDTPGDTPAPDADGDGIPDSEDPDAGAGAGVPVPRTVHAGDNPNAGGGTGGGTGGLDDSGFPLAALLGLAVVLGHRRVRRVTA